MRVGVIGVNHKSADLNLREQMAKATAHLFSKRFSLVLLTTCNRTEIYFSSIDLAEAHSEILSFLRDKIKETFDHHLYSYFGEDCFTHLAIVTAGLDSVVVLESEIQRQAKLAYESSLLNYTLSKEIHYLFQKSFKIAKKIRTSYSHIRSRVSLEGMIYQLSTHFFPHLQETKILFVGNSKVNRDTVAYFKKKGIEDISLSTRSLHYAKEFCHTENIALSNIEDWQKFDLVICGTKTGEYLLKVDDLKKGYQTKLILDLGVPRNVDPTFRLHPHISLLNIEEIGNLMKKKEDDLLKTIEEIKEKTRHSVQKQLFLLQEKETTCV